MPSRYRRARQNPVKSGNLVYMKLDGGFVTVRFTVEQMSWVRALARYRASTPAGILRRALVREWELSKEKVAKLLGALEEIER